MQPSSPNPSAPNPGIEFVLLLAFTISLVALSIDSMLPALPEIARDLGAADPNDRQMVITVLFAGFGIAQILYGPVSDSVGRKPAIYAGFAIFTLGSVICLLARDFDTMLLGRFLQGFGAAGPRTVVVAMVRDRFEGRAMARIMSLVTSVFILVPVLAPALGQGILLVAHWRAIYWMLLILGLGTGLWFALRQEETLDISRRRELSLGRILRAVIEVFRNRISFGYMTATGLVFGAFIGYLASSQQIFQEMYGVGKWFAVYFGILAISFGAASLLNARLVMRFGMRLLSGRAQWAHTLLSIAFAVAVVALDGVPPLPLFVGYMMATFFLIGILFGNFNALAMSPLGHIAGVGAAVIGACTTFISVGCGAIIGAAYQGTVLPLVVGFAVLGACSLAVTWWAEQKGRG
ncbi:DHA1 family bicyclomycin/chloramphenicol resistance-like MFS transporter [Dongia mobilis]|uniref:DHA1 family bicyclomycin/chloramphenicol resistance-like MFS transporter n=1 Tax=Dongia mobilis TaxID=578943 RepID=A0A4R6WV49_9PROT|nr:multidrug effflux MFS transporter [Dongia mobilis]TDQ84309.1 DHA1 family bicyclomycin/chloramphenicol resistance-like MFS transporter [Dongia mobilis]